MEILYFLESIRMPGLNEFMLAITELGDETAFLVASMIVFWCVDKYKGYYLMLVGFIGTIANQFLKLVCRIPRPWVLDEHFTILEEAREAATGYSFPSGHSQNAVGTFGAIAHTTSNPWVKGIAIAIAVLVPLSRMYVGVHTPKDVLVGSAMALALVLALKKPVMKKNHGTMKFLIALTLLLAVGFLAYVEFWTFPADMDPHNMESGLKNAYTLLGSMVGLAVVYLLDRRYVNFSTRACWWAQLLKIVLGLALVLAVKEGLKSPLEALCGADGIYVARGIRYFFVVLVAGAVWPLSFRWFGRMGARK